MRNTIKDANLADKLSAEDKEAIEKAVDGVVAWLDHNQVCGCMQAWGCAACAVCWAWELHTDPGAQHQHPP